MKTRKEHSGILLWDVETSPLLVTSWGLRKPYLTHENIVTEWNILTAAWKWLDQDTVYHVSIDIKKPRNDKALVKELHKNLSMANVLVAHNGDKFDLRKFNARAVYHGLDPLPLIRTIDTLKVARKYFSFTSNRLDYLGKLFFGEGKERTDYGLWLDVLNKDQDALDKMLSYNDKDVILLERIYKKLCPYIQNHPNRALMNDGELNACPNCGSKDFYRNGVRTFINRLAQRYRCRECGSSFSGNYKQ